MSERKRRLLPILGAIVLLVAAGGGWAWWQSSRHVRDTDNAYVNADIAQVSSLVAGPVSRVVAHDNQFVHKGDVLFEIDRRPFEVALAKARARLASAELASRQDAADVGDQADAILAREDAACRVNGGYAIEAEPDPSGRGVRPAHIKDRVRAYGPTVRPDLTLKPADPEAGSWVI